MRHHDGRWLWFETAIRAVRDVGGVVIERQAAMRQIEERRRLQGIVERQRDEATNMLAEQSALRKIATLVAAGAPPSTLFGAVAEQLALLFDGVVGSVVRFDAATGVGDYVGGWSPKNKHLAGLTIDLTGNTATAQVYREGRSAEVAEYGGHATDPFLEEFTLGGGCCRADYRRGQAVGRRRCGTAPWEADPHRGPGAPGQFRRAPGRGHRQCERVGDPVP
jgi:hypothetical protein